VYTVFNAEQMDGIPPHQPKQRQDWEIAETGERILQNSGANIRHDQNDRAFYNRAQDAIHLPPRDASRSAPDYYGTALHELAHWSGHPSRLNRQTLNESYRFGDTNYAKEELRAELTSVFLAAERGIPHNPEQHAAYVFSWVGTLKNDKNEIFRAAKDAHTAADFIIGFENAREVQSPGHAQIRRETSEHVAEYERTTGTVNIIDKEAATEGRNPAPANGARTTDRLAPARAQTEKILDGEVQGRTAPGDSRVQQSLADAQDRVREHLGEAARMYPADTESGRYRGEIVAETDQHMVQKLSARSATAHPKELLPDSLSVGQSVAISYSNGQAQTKPFKAREKAQALAR
jgi:hypothetical protein